MVIQLLCLSAPVFFCSFVHLSICMSVVQSVCLAQSHQDILKLHSLHPNPLFLSCPLSSVSITDSLNILSVSSSLCLHLHNLQVLAHFFTIEFPLWCSQYSSTVSPASGAVLTIQSQPSYSSSQPWEKLKTIVLFCINPSQISGIQQWVHHPSLRKVSHSNTTTRLE